MGTVLLTTGVIYALVQLDQQNVMDLGETAHPQALLANVTPSRGHKETSDVGGGKDPRS
jgi:hypothetical protein